MSTQPKRFARIEIVPADLSRAGVDVTDFPKSYRPHFLRLRSSNGAILVTSEIYDDITNARRAAKSLRRAFLQVGFAEANGRPPVVEVTR